MVRRRRVQKGAYKNKNTYGEYKMWLENKNTYVRRIKKSDLFHLLRSQRTENRKKAYGEVKIKMVSSFFFCVQRKCPAQPKIRLRRKMLRAENRVLRGAHTDLPWLLRKMPGLTKLLRPRNSATASQCPGIYTCNERVAVCGSCLFGGVRASRSISR